MNAARLNGTVPPHLTRLLVEAGGLAGVEPRAFARISGLSALGDDRVRIPTRSMMRVWEELSVGLRGAGGGTRPIELWRPGRLGAWDYLFTAAGTLTEAFADADRHFTAVTDPRDAMAATRDDDGLTIVYHGPYEELPVVGEFALSLLLAQARSGAGRDLRPTRIRLPGAARSRHRDLSTAFATREIEFEAPRPSITFTAADAERPFPRADPALAAILREHARLTVATARPVHGWLDRLHAEIDRELATGAPTLEQVAHRLNLSVRTLQRRLRDEDTTWSAELERIRAERVERLLTTTALPVEAIAARVGYRDPRALRRAVHRWLGRGPGAVRAGR